MEIEKSHFPGPGKLWKREVFQSGCGKVLEFFWKILKYPEMNDAQCHIKHCISFVCSFYYLYRKT